MTKLGAILVAGLLFGGVAFAENTDTTLAPPGCYIGTGCDPNGWTSTDSADGNLELGLSAIIRSAGAPGEGTNPGSIDGEYYSVPDGGASGKPTYASWNYNYSINADLAGNGGSLADYTFLLTVTDLSNGSLPVLSYDPTLAALGDNTMGNYGAQNSENLHFGAPEGFGAAFDPSATDDYEIVLQATDTETGLVTSDTIFVDVAPEPSTWTLMALALCGIVLLGRRRRQQAE